MSFKKSIKKISVVALLALTVSPVCGQDLLARQAPVDHRMKSLDTLAVSHYRMIEDRENPAAELYEDFSNKYAHRATTLPEHFRIDLRHFCMPLLVALSQVTSVIVLALAANIKVWTSRFILATQSAQPFQAEFAS